MYRIVCLAFYLSFLFQNVLISQEHKTFTTTIPDIEFISSTFLGNKYRNYYGNTAPEKLDIIWKFHLGSGTTADPHNKNKPKKMYGAGWTGQAATLRQDSNFYLIQPSFSHKLFKINAANGNKIWEYSFDDILKGSPTLWHNNYTWDKNRILIFQG
ncbi:MAG: hypothetical protein ACQES1_05680, partial [Bacteroidota bacterium]